MTKYPMNDILKPMLTDPIKDKAIAQWRKSQLHWDGKAEISKKKKVMPKSVALNWDKMTRIMRELCRSERRLKKGQLFLLDIGSGGGGFLKGIEAEIDRYIGIDPSDVMLSYAKPHKNRSFIRAVGEELPLKSEIADIVLIKSALDQCYDPSKVISEAARVLKRGGLILISLSNRRAYYNLLKKRFCEGSHQFHFSYQEVESLMESGGFQIKSSFDIGYFFLPHSIQFLIPNGLFPRIVNLADKVGKLILSHRGGCFILAGQKS